ncbi:hypothetical protein ACA910_021048 [Epithemia clementina (nom. ined.)]
MTWSSLHEACKHNDTDAILKLADLNDEAFQTDDHGATPLHLLCLNAPDMLAVKVLVAANNMAVSDRDVNGDTPVHLLCRNANINKAIVELLVRVDPHSLSVANKHGYLPLHVACKYATTNRDLLSLLIKTNPYALLHHVKIGDLIVRKRSSLERNTDQITDHIIDPSAGLKTIDTIDLRMMQNDEFVRDGGYPLHIAIAHGATLDIVQLLTSNNGREALELTNKFGQTPLLVALLNQADEDVVRYLLSLYPDALHIPDNQGNLPLHVAAKCGAETNTFEALLGQWPTSASEVNSQGLKASDLAIRHGKCSEEAKNLLAAVKLQETK